jgi:hypothetical protein
MGHADHSMRGRYTHTFEAQLAADAKALDEHTLDSVASGKIVPLKIAV